MSETGHYKTGKHTEGKAVAEKWGDPTTDPRWIIKLNEKIRFQTAGDEDEENATELVRRWNAFEEGGSHKALVEACEEAKVKRGQYREIIEALLVPTNFISIEAARSYICEAVESYGLGKIDPSSTIQKYKR